MAESSYFWTTSSAGDGASTYTRSDLSAAFKVMGAVLDDEGIGIGYLQALVPGTTGANNAQIGTGGALVDGKPYYNSAAVNVTIPSAAGGGNTRIDRVVLRADWTAQTVRITRIAGIDAASPTAPAITQTTGVVYDIQICQALVNTSGTVTITDERTLAYPGTGTIRGAAILALNISSGLIALGAVGTAQMAANSVDDTIAGSRVPQFYRRQGADASDWSQTSSTVNQTPTAVRQQAGAIATSSGGAVTVTFPTAFSGVPLVVATASGSANFAVIETISSSGFTISTFSNSITRTSAVAYWFAVGAE